MRRRTYLGTVPALVAGTALSGCSSNGEIQVGDEETTAAEETATDEPPGATTTGEPTTASTEPTEPTETTAEPTDGLSIELLWEDTQTDPTAGIGGAQSLVNRGVPYVCGPASSGVALPVFEDVLIPNDVVGCSPSATALPLTNLEDDDYVFRTAPSDALQARAMAQVAAADVGADTAAVVAIDNTYGQSFADRFRRAFETTVGGSVTAELFHASGRSSYTSLLQQALSTEPDALVVISYPDPAAQLFRDYYADFGAPASAVLVSDALRAPDVPEAVDEEMDDVVGLAPAADGPGLDAFRRAYEAQYDRSPGPFGEQAYDAVAVGILAGAAAGSDDPAAVRDQMRAVANPGGAVVTPENFAAGVAAAARGEAVDYRGAASVVNFDERGDPAVAPYELWEYGGDSIREIEVRQFEGETPRGSGPADSDAPGSDPGRTIPIGLLLPETGILGEIGDEMIDAARLPVEQVDEADLRL